MPPALAASVAAAAATGPPHAEPTAIGADIPALPCDPALPERSWVLARPDGVELAVHEWGDPSWNPVLLAHGVGSRAAFVAECFGEALAARQWRLVAPDLRGHGASTPLADPRAHALDHHVDDLRALADACGAAILGGISLGAHAALRVAAEGQTRGLLLALLGWLGPGSTTARANAEAAAALRIRGLDAVLHDMGRSAAPTWVVDEVQASWRGQDRDSLIAALEAIAAEPLGHPSALASITCPVAVLALTDDPAHPLDAGRAVVGALARARLATTSLSALAERRSLLGERTLAAWSAARPRRRS